MRRIGGVFDHLQRTRRHLYHMPKRRAPRRTHTAQHIRNGLQDEGFGLWRERCARYRFTTTAGQHV